MVPPVQLWRLFEPYHAVVYFDPAARTRSKEVGWSGFWMGYFAMRAAPLGAVPPSVVTAAFFGFAPRMVERALPSAWAACPPERALEVRLAVADDALRRVLGSAVDGPEVREAAQLAAAAAEAAPTAGRPLAAANAALPRPEPPHLALWHAATVLREHRGDGHVAALVAAGVGPLEAHVLAVGAGTSPRESLVAHRGWTEEEWAEAEARVADWPAGVRGEIDSATERAAAAPWGALDTEATGRLAALLGGLVAPIAEGGGVVYPNPIGLPPPDAVARR